MIQLAVGDKVEMKKKHSCGSTVWEVLRVGQDVRLRCEGCGRLVMFSRHDVEKHMKLRQPTIVT